MHRKCLLIATALGEGSIGVLLLVLPSVPLWLLLGVDQAWQEALFFARIAGAALLALSIACWTGSNHEAAQRRLLPAVLVYDLLATGILAYTGWFTPMAGIALWPAVLLHVALAWWCVVSSWKQSGLEKGRTGPGVGGNQ